MKQKTLSVFTRIEEQRSDIISLYDSLSPDQLRFNPGPGEWNLLQVMSHLVTAEKQSVIYIKRKLARHQDIPKTGFGAKIRHFILRVALILPLKFKAPKIADVAEDFPGYDLMKQEWDEARTELENIIRSSDDDLLSKALYRHPRAGFLNIKQALEFIQIHTAHHQKQIKRILNSTDFPS